MSVREWNAEKKNAVQSGLLAGQHLAGGGANNMQYQQYQPQTGHAQTGYSTQGGAAPYQSQGQPHMQPVYAQPVYAQPPMQSGQGQVQNPNGYVRYN